MISVHANLTLFRYNEGGIYSIILVHVYINSLFQCIKFCIYSIILVHAYIKLSFRCNECGIYSIILVHAYITIFKCNDYGVVTDHQEAMKYCFSFVDNWYKSCDPVTSILTTGNRE